MMLFRSLELIVKFIGYCSDYYIASILIILLFRHSRLLKLFNCCNMINRIAEKWRSLVFEITILMIIVEVLSLILW